MRVETFIKRTRIPAPAEEVFAWHARPGALARLTPPWEHVEVLSQTGGIRDGARVLLRIGSGPAALAWIAEHRNYVEGRQFQDVQVEGPFALWEHTHTFIPEDDGACILEDHVRYALPLGPAGRLADRLVRKRIERMFAYRHQVTHDDILAHRNGRTTTMKVAVTGSTGLIGSRLVSFLTTGGHEVSRLVRTAATKKDEIAWQPAEGRIDKSRLEGHDVVVHLGGDNIGEGRWTEAKKKRIYDSRVDSTTLLSRTLCDLQQPPKLFFCASAIGYYGDRAVEPLEESASPGGLFVANVCRAWEAATEPAQAKGIRVVQGRFGIVLAGWDGPLKKMLLPFKLGLGGKVGDGKQYWSWIDLDDAVGAIHHVITHDELRGPVNIVSPQPVTNAHFTKTLGRVLRRPTIFPLPAAVARVVMGDMADELLLASAKVIPTKLQGSGYGYRYPELELSLRHQLGN